MTSLRVARVENFPLQLSPRPHTLSVITFVNVTAENSGVLTCGAEIATLFVEQELSNITVSETEWGVSDSLQVVTNPPLPINFSTRLASAVPEFSLSCTALGSPVPNLRLAVYDVITGDEVKMRLTGRQEAKGEVTVTWSRVKNEVPLLVRYNCSARQLLSKGRVLTRSVQGVLALTKPLVLTIETTPPPLYTGSASTILCTAAGNPTPSHLSLFKDNNLIKITAPFQGGSTTEGISYYTATLLHHLTNLSLHDNGTYTCSSSAVGHASVPGCTGGLCVERVTVEVNPVTHLRVRMTSPDIDVTKGSVLVASGHHPLIQCAASSLPPPIQLSLLVNNVTSYYTTALFSPDTMRIQGFIPVSDRVVIECRSWKWCEGCEEGVRVVLEPSPIVGESNEVLVMGLFAGVTLVVLTAVLVAVLCCVKECTRPAVIERERSPCREPPGPVITAEEVKRRRGLMSQLRGGEKGEKKRVSGALKRKDVWETTTGRKVGRIGSFVKSLTFTEVPDWSNASYEDYYGEELFEMSRSTSRSGPTVTSRSEPVIIVGTGPEVERSGSLRDVFSTAWNPDQKLPSAQCHPALDQTPSWDYEDGPGRRMFTAWNAVEGPYGGSEGTRRRVAPASTYVKDGDVTNDVGKAGDFTVWNTVEGPQGAVIRGTTRGTSTVSMVRARDDVTMSRRGYDVIADDEWFEEDYISVFSLNMLGEERVGHIEEEGDYTLIEEETSSSL